MKKVPPVTAGSPPRSANLHPWFADGSIPPSRHSDTRSGLDFPPYSLNSEACPDSSSGEQKSRDASVGSSHWLSPMAGKAWSRDLLGPSF